MVSQKTGPAPRNLRNSQKKSNKGTKSETKPAIRSTLEHREKPSNKAANGAVNRKKRLRTSDAADGPVKRVKTVTLINSPPIERLKIFVFGSGESGELGLGAEITTRNPESAEIPRLNHLLDPEKVGVTQVAVGGMHCAALTHDGHVITWGVNDSKALGRDTQWTPPDDLPDNMTDLNPLESTPTVVTGLDGIDSGVVQVAACDNATFILTASGNVHGWGTFFGNDGAFGFLKSKAASRHNLYQTTPIQVAGLTEVKELAAGVNHMLALTRDGNVYAWGSGQQAELGHRVVTRHRKEALLPRLVALPKKGIVKIFAGFNHSFAIDTHGSVWSWGLNNFGQTGHPTDEEHLHIEMPQVVESLKDYQIQHIAGGFHHSLACTADGDVLAWGRCDDKQLGLDLAAVPKNGVLTDGKGRARIVLVPVKVPGLKARSVAAGIDNSLAVDEEGKVLSWGFSENFRTGLRTEDAVGQPTPLKSKAMTGMTFTYVGCGGQFSVIAGPAAS